MKKKTEKNPALRSVVSAGSSIRNQKPARLSGGSTAQAGLSAQERNAQIAGSSKPADRPLRSVTLSDTLVQTQDLANCPVRQVLDRFGDKWSILIIVILGERRMLRFNELGHAIGDISQKMLTVTLRSLEADGLITRKFYPEIPPRVEYTLTELGSSLLPLILHLAGWADQHIDIIRKNRQKYEDRSAVRV